MDAKASPLTDPVALVRGLNAETIRNRIDDLDREREALLVLLRAAQRTERARQRKATAATGSTAVQ
jgi:hypothetical protein